METLTEFFLRMDAAASEILIPHDAGGHKDLPEYLSHMGPRYKIPADDWLLSVFRGEGQALFLIARTLRPLLIVDAYTGTGYAAACLAAGAPDAGVISADREERYVYFARGLAGRLALANLTILHGGPGDILRAAGGREPELVLRDPYHGDPVGGTPLTVEITHDRRLPLLKGCSFHVRGGSHMIVSCSQPKTYALLRDTVGAFMPVWEGE